MSDGDAGRTSIVLFGIHSAARVVGFLGLIYFTRVLPPTDLDVYFLFFVVVQVSALFSRLGVGQALVRRISEHERRGAVYTAAILTVVTSGLLATGGFYLFRDPVSAYIGADVPLVLSGATVTWLLADVHLRTLQGEDRVLTAGVLQIVQDIVRVGVGAALITIGWGPFGLMVGVVAGFGTTVVGGRIATSVPLAVPGRRDVERLFSISKYTMFHGPTNFVYFWLDTAMIGLLLLPGSVSPYEVAWQTTRVLVIATGAINQTIFPKVSTWANEGLTSEIERILPGAVVFTLVFPIPGLVGIAVLGEELLGTVYRPSYAVAAVPMVVLAGYMVVEGLQRIANSTLTGLDRADLPFRARLVGVTLAVVLNVLLIPRYGLLGAAVATFTAKTVDTLLQWRGLTRLIEVRFPVTAVGWELVSAVVMGGVVYAASTVVPGDSFPSLAALIAIGVITYGMLALFNPDIRQVVDRYSPIDLPIPQ